MTFDLIEQVTFRKSECILWKGRMVSHQYIHPVAFLQIVPNTTEQLYTTWCMVETQRIYMNTTIHLQIEDDWTLWSITIRCFPYSKAETLQPKLELISLAHLWCVHNLSATHYIYVWHVWLQICVEYVAGMFGHKSCVMHGSIRDTCDVLLAWWFLVCKQFFSFYFSAAKGLAQIFTSEARVSTQKFWTNEPNTGQLGHTPEWRVSNLK